MIEAMDTQNQIAIWALASSTITGVGAWIVSARAAKKDYSAPRLDYSISTTPLLVGGGPGARKGLRVEYNGELLPEPVLLSVDIINVGYVAIENPPIEIEAVGPTYVIPGYFEDVPPGYEKLWALERTDAESCAVHLTHINPGQVAKVRFLLDEQPRGEPIFKCPMKDLRTRRVGTRWDIEPREVVIALLPYPIAPLARALWRRAD
jgi:hypothetical protein